MTTDSFRLLPLFLAVLVGFVLTAVITLLLLVPITVGAAVLYVYWRSGDRFVRLSSGQPS